MYFIKINYLFSPQIYLLYKEYLLIVYIFITCIIDVRTNKDDEEEEMKRWTKKFKEIYIHFALIVMSSATISITR